MAEIRVLRGPRAHDLLHAHRTQQVTLEAAPRSRPHVTAKVPHHLASRKTNAARSRVHKHALLGEGRQAGCVAHGRINRHKHRHHRASLHEARTVRDRNHELLKRVRMGAKAARRKTSHADTHNQAIRRIICAPKRTHDA